MALEQKLHLKLAQKLVMTPTLQQAIKLLQLSRLELEQALAQEIQANPLLEMAEENPSEEEASAAEAPGDAGEAAQGEEAAARAEEAAEDERAGDTATAEEVARAEEAATFEEPAATEGVASADAFGEVELDALFANYLHDAPSVAPAWDDSEERSLENSPGRAESMFADLCS
ncbi:MAG TPA: hypothetical protein VMT45_16175, partial [Thermoanaerobaculaceae bacterium]|nr:hypothetical protein [Thermoanaerobaculaceae bacterium]